MATKADAIRSFPINFPEEALVDLRRRINATKWPERETVADATQGAQLATTQALARYWGTDYDWRKFEARLNALPHTNIDGLDIHFIHVRSKNPNALPLIVTHGWPGSIIEQLKIIDPLTNPTAHGDGVEDAFDIVIPSVPGYGFSGRPHGTGWDPRSRCACLGGTVETPRLHALRRSGRRLGHAHLQRNGTPEGRRIAGYPYQFACDRAARGRGGAGELSRRAFPSRSARCSTRSGRTRGRETQPTSRC
jgi:Epoxide hydrolase N terminus